MNWKPPLALLTMALLASCNQAAPADTAVKAHTIKQLMATVVQPQADIFWGAAGSVTDETGTHDLRPTTDERWLATVSAAATLTEMGNLLMTPQYSEGRGEDWNTFAKGLVDIGQKAEKAATDKVGEDEMFEIGGQVYNVCSACHEAYPAETPGE